MSVDAARIVPAAVAACGESPLPVGIVDTRDTPGSAFDALSRDLADVGLTAVDLRLISPLDPFPPVAAIILGTGGPAASRALRHAAVHDIPVIASAQRRLVTSVLSARIHSSRPTAPAQGRHHVAIRTLQLMPTSSSAQLNIVANERAHGDTTAAAVTMRAKGTEVATLFTSAWHADNQGVRGQLHAHSIDMACTRGGFTVYANHTPVDSITATSQVHVEALTIRYIDMP